jgi:hypothetical protein
MGGAWRFGAGPPEAWFMRRALRMATGRIAALGFLILGY